MSNTDFIKKIAPDAQRILANYKILASLVIAQGCLESAYGTSGLAVKGKNLFGVKGEYNGQYVIMQTWEVINGKNVQVPAKFRKYPSWYESMQDLAKLYVNGTSWNPNHYKAVVGERDYKKATAALVKAGYATDPAYATKLNGIIETYNLTQYDKTAVSESPSPGTTEPTKPINVVPTSIPKDTENSADVLILSLTGDVELLVGFSTTRKLGINSEKTITISGIKTSLNSHACEYVSNENIIVYKNEPYVIKTVTVKPKGNTLEIKADAIHKMFIDLRDNYVYETVSGVKAYRPDKALEIALKGSGYDYEINNEGLATSVSIENYGDGNSLTLLNSIADKFGAEYECVDSTVYFAKEIGRVTDNQIRYKYNVNDPQQEIDTSDLKTYIRGFGKGVQAEYTSPLASVFGIRHADPVRDERYTQQSELLARIKRDLHDQIDISISLTYVELRRMGVQDIRKGDYVWCIIDPFDIDVRLRVTEVEDYSDPYKSPKFTLGSISRKSTDIVADFNRASRELGKVIDSSTGKIKMSSISIGSGTNFETGYDPTKLQIPTYDLANATTDGLLSSKDFIKLSNLKIGPDGQVYVPLATSSNDGLLSRVDFAKLQMIEVGGSVVSLPNILEQLKSIEQRLTTLEGGGTDA
ncbi:phage tail protein [Bacillus spizizenii]|uniref:phage tail protein n=1 Tax=Bacillus spizizenii TaxID=96241 RepID=UPI002FCACC58